MEEITTTVKNTINEAKVSMADFEIATYKSYLTLQEHTDLVCSITQNIQNFISEGKAGRDSYIIKTFMVAYCTNIQLEGSSEVMWKFVSTSGVMDKIKENLGEAYDEVMSDIHNAVTYILSSNPETKILITNLSAFIKNLANTQVSDSKISELMSAMTALNK